MYFCFCVLFLFMTFNYWEIVNKPLTEGRICRQAWVSDADPVVFLWEMAFESNSELILLTLFHLASVHPFVLSKGYQYEQRTVNRIHTDSENQKAAWDNILCLISNLNKRKECEFPLTQVLWQSAHTSTANKREKCRRTKERVSAVRWEKRGEMCLYFQYPYSFSPCDSNIANWKFGIFNYR